MAGRCGLAAPSSGKGLVVGCCEYGNEPSVCIKGGKLLDHQNDCWLLIKDCAL
jgi:hypothetical protein